MSLSDTPSDAYVLVVTAAVLPFGICDLAGDLPDLFLLLVVVGSARRADIVLESFDWSCIFLESKLIACKSVARRVTADGRGKGEEEGGKEGK